MAAVKIQLKNCLQSTLRKEIINTLFAGLGRSLLGKNCALGLEYGPWPATSGGTQDLWQSFSQYGPPGRQITYIYLHLWHFTAEYNLGGGEGYHV